MPGSTSRGYPYPLGPEQAAGATNIQALGEAVDADVGTLLPVGAIIAYGGTAAPSGWQLCDGSAAGSPALSAVVGANVPDLRDKFVVGAGSTRPAASSGGRSQIALTESELPSHAHGVNDPSHAHGVSDPTHSHGQYVSADTGPGPAVRTDYVSDADGDGAPIYPQGVLTDPSYTGIGINGAYTGISIAAAGGGAAFDSMPPYYALTYIIKL